MKRLAPDRLPPGFRYEAHTTATAPERSAPARVDGRPRSYPSTAAFRRSTAVHCGPLALLDGAAGVARGGSQHASPPRALSLARRRLLAWPAQ